MVDNINCNYIKQYFILGNVKEVLDANVLSLYDVDVEDFCKHFSSSTFSRHFIDNQIVKVNSNR